MIVNKTKPHKSVKGVTNKSSMIDIDKTAYKKFLTNNLTLFLDDTEKYKDEKTEVKKLVQFYDSIGRNQVVKKRKEIQSLRDIANGVINKEDFIKGEEIAELKKLDPNFNFKEEDVDLEFFPIAPNLINRLTGEIDKKHMEFTIQAIDDTATNEILEQRNSELLQILQDKLIQSFQGQIEDPNELQQVVQQKLSEYSIDYRHEIEEWAGHVQEVENQKFNIPKLKRDIFRELAIHEEPYIHVECTENEYYPEIVRPEDAFFLKSKKISDASNYTMFGWYNYIDFATILNKHQLDEDQIKILETWQQYYKAGFANANEDLMKSGNTSYQATVQNYYTFKTLEDYPASDPNHRLIRETYMYFLLPKKVGVLTTIMDGELYSLEIDETFKVTHKPKYKYKGNKREDLIEGEHVEYTYITELWKCKKLDLSYSSPFLNIQDKDVQSIWVFLDRNPIQYKHKHLRYGIKIPVHGGSEFGWSIASKVKPWQKFYNYLANRNKQLLSNELGKFALINQNILPQRSFDGTWGENNLLKAYLTARDLGMMPTDPSLTNVGQLQAGAGVVQEIDLTRTKDVADKFQLMNMIKLECYDSIGLNPQFLADISPYQSGKSVAIGQQTTITQLQFLYSKFYDIFKAVRETMLETALYMTSKGLYRELTYLNSDMQRIIFKLGIEDTLLYDLALFVNSDVSDTITLETIKELAKFDNTMGADALEKATILASKSVPQVMSKLKKVQIQKQKEIEAQRKHEQEMQQKQIEANQAALERQIQNENEQKALDRENDIRERRITALGYANDNAATIAKEILEIDKLGLQRDSLELDRQIHEDSLISTQKELESANLQKENDNELKDRIEIKKLEMREKEIDEANKRTAAMVKAKANSK